ncbi:MAG: hypothetical protein Q9165_000487 [Trypethelium subeluteriae]
MESLMSLNFPLLLPSDILLALLGSLNAASVIVKSIHVCKGNQAQHYARLHERYGEVVRVSPTELSYITTYAWNDIYGFRQGHEEFNKRRFLDPDLGESILIVDRTGHQRMRRLISHAFSEKALREQEPLIKKYVDLLVKRLRETDGQSTNLVAWYNFTTFDLIGDLAFGEPFDCLKDSSYKPWVTILFDNIKEFIYAMSTIEMFGAGFAKVLSLIVPESLLRNRKAHVALTKDKVAKRLKNGTERPDFMSYILRHNDEKGLTHPEIESNSEVLIVAGSETTATLLSGATYYLLRNPRVMKKLVEEVRTSFTQEEEINLTGVNRLVYMLAVLDEALRIYPPAAGSITRVVPTSGGTVGGKWLPGGTLVAVSHLAAYRSPRNFKDPDSFVPERWLGDPVYADDNKAVFQPFNIGPRSCIGRNLAYVEMRLILARVLWNFDLEMMPESENWTDQKCFILWEKNPLYVKLTPANRG